MIIAPGTKYRDYASQQHERVKRPSDRRPRATIPAHELVSPCDIKLSDYDLCVGDLVLLRSASQHGGGIVFRITKDCPPVGEASWGKFFEAVTHPYRRKGGPTNHLCMSWVWPNRDNKQSRRHVPTVRLHGCVELSPVWSFFPRGEKKHVVAYDSLERLVKRVDLVRPGDCVLDVSPLHPGRGPSHEHHRAAPRAADPGCSGNHTQPVKCLEMTLE